MVEGATYRHKLVFVQTTYDLASISEQMYQQVENQDYTGTPQCHDN